MARLSKWPNEVREEFARLLAGLRNVKAAEREIYEIYPDAQRYPYATLLAYSRSDQGKEEIMEVRSGVREEAKNSPLVHRGERLAVLVEAMEIVLDRLRMVYDAGYSMKTTDMVKLSGEVRELVAEIRKEAAPYDEDAVVPGSPLEKFFALLKAAPKEIQPLLMEWDSAAERETHN